MSKYTSTPDNVVRRRRSGSKGTRHYHDKNSEYVISRRRKGFLKYLMHRQHTALPWPNK